MEMPQARFRDLFFGRIVSVTGLLSSARAELFQFNSFIHSSIAAMSLLPLAVRFAVFCPSHSSCHLESSASSFFASAKYGLELSCCSPVKYASKSGENFVSIVGFLELVGCINEWSTGCVIGSSGVEGSGIDAEERTPVSSLAFSLPER
ncbi:hypothetical protein BJ742DRAFT_386342 [Cladochytrium replicatum]|nr:hypothetical protein BJ742DRAFT_386342 [Cladochytrium replicatum]